MYAIILALHNIIRWVVVILGLLATGRTLLGWLGTIEWLEKESRIGLYFTSSVDIQKLMGVLLYFIFSDWGLKVILEKGVSFVIGHGEFRFYAIEHVTYMILGFVFAHLGSALSKGVEDHQVKHKRAAIWYGLAIILIVAGTPWSRRLFP